MLEAIMTFSLLSLAAVMGSTGTLVALSVLITEIRSR